MFQFGVVAVFLAPMLYHNENQPDQTIRILQALGGKSRFCQFFTCMISPFQSAYLSL
jgi:hypothetical protein